MADEGSEQVGLWDLALPIYCIDVTPIDGGPRGTASYVAPTGTGFCVAPGVLVTCWHCVKPRSDGRRYAAVSWNGAELGHHLLNRISQDPTGLDLATAQIDYEPVQRFAPWPDADTVGTDVWSVGYPLTESDALPSGMRQWHPEPRYLRGYVTRVFVNPDHPDFGPQRSYELDMAMPGGMSGGPLLARNIFNSGLWITVWAITDSRVSRSAKVAVGQNRLRSPSVVVSDRNSWVKDRSGAARPTAEQR